MGQARADQRIIKSSRMIVVKHTAPKAQNSVAQGNALGSNRIYYFAFVLKGRNRFYCAPSGRDAFFLCE